MARKAIKAERKHTIHTPHHPPSSVQPLTMRPSISSVLLHRPQQPLSLLSPSALLLLARRRRRQTAGVKSCHPKPPQPDRIGSDTTRTRTGGKIARAFLHCSVSGLHPHPRGKIRDPIGLPSSLIGSGAAGRTALLQLMDFGTWDSPCLATCLSAPNCLPAARLADHPEGCSHTCARLPRVLGRGSTISR